jgi:hypothetical protein
LQQQNKATATTKTKAKMRNATSEKKEINATKKYYLLQHNSKTRLLQQSSPEP